MKLVLLLLHAVLASAAFDKHWEEFNVIHGKKYMSNLEEQFRRKVFEDNLRRVDKHNKEAALGLHGYTLDFNSKFADRTLNELISLRTGFRPDFHPAQNSLDEIPSTFLPPPSNVDLPDEVDWRKLGAVTQVKDQGQCGSCWAFAATGTLEGAQFRKTGKLVSLSEEQLIDCTVGGKYKLRACIGGVVEIALNYIKENGGLDTEESYPYLTEEIPKDLTCRFRNETVGAVVKDVVKVKWNDEEALKAAVATVGPVAAGIDTLDSSFFQYKSGVYYEKKCLGNIDHAVLIVGYGHDNVTGMDYWLVKNSWGPDWGEEGYIRMARNRDNNCSIATRAIYAVV